MCPVGESYGWKDFVDRCLYNQRLFGFLCPDCLRYLFRFAFNPFLICLFSVTVSVDNKPIRMELCDTAGRAEFDSLRPLSYTEANVFLLCFKVTDHASFYSITEHWLPEIRAVAPNVPGNPQHPSYVLG